MNRCILAFGILATMFAVGYCTTCDKLSWRRDVDLIDMITRSTRNHTLYRTLQKNMECGVGKYYQFCPDQGLYTFMPPNGSNNRPFKFTCEGEGLFGKYDWENGVFDIRKVNYYLEDENGYGVCIFTCDCNRVDFKSFDCYISSKDKIAPMELAIEQANITLKEDQNWNICKTFLNRTSSGIM